MAIYTVLAPPDRDGALAPDMNDSMRFVFVKEGICWPALIFALPWLIFRRMWLVLIGYVIIIAALSFLDARLGGPIIGFAILLTHLFLTLEGNQLRRWTLERRGYRFVGVVEGRGVEEAEIRYFADATPAALADAVPVAAPLVAPAPPTPPVPPMPPVVPPPAPVPPAPWRGPESSPMAPASAEAGDVVGLFPAPQPQRGGWS